jgi:hypothetical protein
MCELQSESVHRKLGVMLNCSHSCRSRARLRPESARLQFGITLSFHAPILLNLTCNLMCQRLLPELGGGADSAVHRHRLPLSFGRAARLGLEGGYPAFPPLVLRCSSGGPPPPLFQLIREKHVLVVDDNLIGTRPEHIARAKDLFRATAQANLRKEWVAQATVNFGASAMTKNSWR